MRKRILYFIICIPTVLLTACNVHEWFDEEDISGETISLHLKLSYDTNLTELEYVYDGEDVALEGLDEKYDNKMEAGIMRYIIRAYPTSTVSSSSDDYTEFIYTQDVTETYDYETTITLPVSDYTIMVWSDLVEEEGDTYFYDADDFSDIQLQGDYQGSNDYKDAFKGSVTIKISDTDGAATVYAIINMDRPLAKFEFITTDLSEFITKVQAELAEASAGTSDETKASLENYKAVFYFSNYTPISYDMFNDWVKDSTTGVQFESELISLSETEASMGFDYIIAYPDEETTVTVQIAIYDSDGTLRASTSSIGVPLRRDYHTIIRGEFLMTEASGGIGIDPDYGGDYNVYI